MKMKKTDYKRLVLLGLLILSIFCAGMSVCAAETAADPVTKLKEKTVSFTSADLDGHTVTSKELFKDNKITMIYMWGPWHTNCVDEMEELAKLHTKLQEKGCGIVGLESERDQNEETLQAARKLLKEKGTNYPNVMLNCDTLEVIKVFPTALFVDSEGTILADPISEANIQKYEETLDALLNDTSVPKTEDPKDGSYRYRVFVKDEEGNPVAEAAVQFCDEYACRMGETDELGCAVFEVTEEKSYEVHILEVPDGFEDLEETFKTDEKASDITIVLKKAE